MISPTSKREKTDSASTDIVFAMGKIFQVYLAIKARTTASDQPS